MSKKFRNPTNYDFSNLEHDYSGFSSTEPPFDFGAEEFLDYAEKDLEKNELRSIINALSNIKRAIHNRIDTLLYTFGYFTISEKEKWNFPEKMKKIEELGILRPKIIERINSKRNLLEHKYKKPNKKEVEDAFEVALLFIGYTEKFIRGFKNDFGFYKKNLFLGLKLIVGKGKIKIYLKKGKNEDKFELEVGEPFYDDWIHVFIKISQMPLG